MTATIPAPENWKEILKYSVYKNGFRVGIRDDAPQEVKESFYKMQKQYESQAKKGTLL